MIKSSSSSLEDISGKGADPKRGLVAPMKNSLRSERAQMAKRDPLMGIPFCGYSTAEFLRWHLILNTPVDNSDFERRRVIF